MYIGAYENMKNYNDISEDIYKDLWSAEQYFETYKKKNIERRISQHS